jgi:hypothetical protein
MIDKLACDTNKMVQYVMCFSRHLSRFRFKVELLNKRSQAKQIMIFKNNFTPSKMLTVIFVTIQMIVMYVVFRRTKFGLQVGIEMIL